MAQQALGKDRPAQRELVEKLLEAAVDRGALGGSDGFTQGGAGFGLAQFAFDMIETNLSLRERFRLPEKKSESASRAIRDTVEAGKIKLANPEQASLRYRHYAPFWA